MHNLDLCVCRMDLSTRAYNGLWRSGYKTLRDVYCMPSFVALYAIKNVGRRSRLDIIDKMRSMGFDDWATKMMKGETG